MNISCSYRCKQLITIAFFIFIIWIIYLANTGQSSIFFQLVAMLPWGDKIGHFVLFGLVTLGAIFISRYKQIHIFGYPVYIASIVVTCLVFIEEYSQLFIESRNFDYNDLTANILGIICFSLLTNYNMKRTKT